MGTSTAPSAAGLVPADLTAAAGAVQACRAVVDGCIRHLNASGSRADAIIDANQQVAYDLAHAASAVENARSVIEYGSRGEFEANIACAFVADAVHDVVSRMLGREADWGAAPGALDSVMPFVRTYRSATFLAALSDRLATSGGGPRHLDPDFDMVADSFRRFAEEQVRTHAEHVHRHNADVPESIIAGLAEMGGFGLSVPEEFGGFATGGEGEYVGMVVATEELSRGSLGIGGSLITRPEIITRALVKGGTESQKQEWLPKIATAEVMAAVAATEPDYGSDVAGLKVTATAVEDDASYAINGVKTWCTFAARANVLLLLARTDPDRTKTHRGLSLFIVPKPVADGHGFAFTQQHADGSVGKMEGRPIDTLGYRGMHSYEVALEDWRVPANHLIGESSGLNKGFYFQMEGFENGRLQTAARAVGLMQAAYEAALAYAENRVVFGHNIGDYQLNKVKLARMAVIIQASRQFSYDVAKLMGKGEGAMEASMVKAYVCRAAEWVTREAMQIHGGMGYAEEYAVSRYFVDARVLSIFEGADETLCLKVIARRLLESAGAQ
jgi:(2S)-methylsuccinyl-CoA dehydrogenase